MHQIHTKVVCITNINSATGKLVHVSIFPSVIPIAVGAWQENDGCTQGTALAQIAQIQGKKEPATILFSAWNTCSNVECSTSW